jgi:hypothetical protein
MIVRMATVSPIIDIIPPPPEDALPVLLTKGMLDEGDLRVRMAPLAVTLAGDKDRAHPKSRFSNAGVNDIGGLPGGPIDRRHRHAAHWEKLVVALDTVLSRKRLRTVHESQRATETCDALDFGHEQLLHCDTTNCGGMHGTTNVNLGLDWRRGQRTVPLSDLSRGDLGAIVAHDLASSGEPHPSVAADVLERFVECANAIRLTGQVGVDHDGHDPPRFFSFFVQGVELTADHVLKFSRRAMIAFESLLVVDVVAVGY